MESFDIHEESERFIRIISGYCLMSDEEHGLDTFIEREGSAEFVTVADSDGKDVRLALDPKADRTPGCGWPGHELLSHRGW
jgi:hypothetical protein